MHANKSEPIESVSAGDIAVFVGLKLARPAIPLVPRVIQYFSKRCTSQNLSYRLQSTQNPFRPRQVKEALDILAREDPTFAVHEDEETGQIIIRGMGELHLDVIVTRAIREFKVQAKIGNPQVTYRESISTKYRHSEKFHKIIAGKENTAGLTIEVEPLPRGTGNQYKKLVRAPAVPQEIFEAIERGIMSAFSSGIQYGYPAVDIGVSL